MFIPLISALRSSSSFESCSTDKVVCLLRVVPMILLFAFVCFVYIMSTKWFYFLDCTFCVVTESNFILLLFYLLYISTKWFVLSLKKKMEYVFWVSYFCFVMLASGTHWQFLWYKWSFQCRDLPVLSSVRSIQTTATRQYNSFMQKQFFLKFYYMYWMGRVNQRLKTLTDFNEQTFLTHPINQR